MKAAVPSITSSETWTAKTGLLLSGNTTKWETIEIILCKVFSIPGFSGSRPLPPQYKDHFTIKTTLVTAQRWSLYQGLTVHDSVVPSRENG